jgi:hypothetical protein
VTSSIKQKPDKLTTRRGRRVASRHLLYRGSTSGAPPPRARRRHRREAPPGRGQVREDLFRHGMVAFASTMPPGTPEPTLSESPVGAVILVNSSPTGPPLPAEHKTARWWRPERTLFQEGCAAITKQTPPPENLLLRRTNLPGPSRYCRFPTHPRARRPPEAEENGALAHGRSTGRFPCASLSCRRGKTWRES